MPLTTAAGITAATLRAARRGHPRAWVRARPGGRGRRRRGLNIRYILTSSPVVRGVVMADGLVSLPESRSWRKIYDDGEARNYEWQGRS